tara:strand:- start:195 stop:1094 length:900 start_codon:yes stop_codon:yes gene_type:complete
MSRTLKELEEFIIENFEVHNFQDNILSKDIVISGFSSINNTKTKTISWINKNTLDSSKIKSELVIAPIEFNLNESVKFDIIQIDNPRLAFAKILRSFFSKTRKHDIHNSAFIHNKTNIADNVSIGAYSSVGENVIIGKNTIIEKNVHISNNVSIGSDCHIKSNTVIGEEGFGVVKDEDKSFIKIPHFGSVIIGNNVELGSMNTVNRGTIEDTIIMDGVKTDDHVHIAHNCIIEQNVIMTPGVTLCGSVYVSEGSWLGAQCTILEGVKIEKESFIGIGAVVIKDTQSKSTYIGNPARKFK